MSPLRRSHFHFKQTGRIAWCSFKHDVQVLTRGANRMEIDHKCAYGPCQCKVEQLGEYCSDHCRQADKLRAESTQCSCGHEACVAAQGI